MYELHFGVPMARVGLCTLNIRHDSNMVSVLLKHSKPKLIFVDQQLLDVATGAIEILSKTSTDLPRLVLILESDRTSTLKTVSTNEILEYERMLTMGKPDFKIKWPRDEWDPISLSYTSGTTSSPKGVVYSHRGAYLNSLAAVLLNEMPSMPIYLWTVPMYYCNGWCLTWAMAAQGGTNICLRNVSANGIFSSISQHKVTHMGYFEHDSECPHK
ncbi:hypothetical protein Vadar_022313 [Vaccinium darrowii]|uniref:Uncharacterized protein n=1 Tax=Vaccinium darrowii TaxID=229202 RepID=A0ACB7Y2J4_9ERIC|nr:hypothetical protein Vadar_022313 [Vaccinium darrowii]